jgi:hypothetical protein
MDKAAILRTARVFRQYKYSQPFRAPSGSFARAVEDWRYYQAAANTTGHYFTQAQAKIFLAACYKEDSYTSGRVRRPTEDELMQESRRKTDAALAAARHVSAIGASTVFGH